MDINKHKAQHKISVHQEITQHKFEYYLLICFLLEVKNNTPSKITIITLNLWNIKLGCGTEILNVLIPLGFTNIAVIFFLYAVKPPIIIGSLNKLESHEAIVECDSYTSFVLSNLPRASITW